MLLAVYANSMLAMLNARQVMRNRSEADTVELSGQRRTHHTNINPMVRSTSQSCGSPLTVLLLQGTRVEIFKETSMITDSHVRGTS